MRLFLIIFLAFQQSVSFSQSMSFVDDRDNTTYRFANIDGTDWMLDNLKLVTAKSIELDRAKLDESNTDAPGLVGRYYHLEELDDVCPSGWRLPTVDDWVHYLKFLADRKDPKVELEIVTVEKPYHHYIKNYEGSIDLFEKGNLLDLQPTGRIEGGVLNLPTAYADYWTIDNNEAAEGRTHAHIMNPWTTIHSHQHHLRPWQKKKLRQFMVRCVR